jgi:hypothetical protein
MEILERSGSGWHVDSLCTAAGNDGSGCNSLLRVSKEDLVYWPGVLPESNNWLGGHDAAVSFRCPVCDTCTDLLKSNWPQNAMQLKTVTTEWYKQ